MDRPLYFAAVLSIVRLLSPFFLLFFLTYSQRSEIGCLPYFHTWCGLSANLECVPEMCCTRLAEIHDAKNHANYHTTCQAISSQLRHVSTVRKKLVKQQYLPQHVLTGHHVWHRLTF